MHRTSSARTPGSASMPPFGPPLANEGDDTFLAHGRGVPLPGWAAAEHIETGGFWTQHGMARTCETSASGGGNIERAPTAQGFDAMRDAFRSTGGMANGDDLARLLEDRRIGDFITLARLIVSEQIFAVGWRNTCWVPMFQFDMHNLSIKPGPRRVIAELSSVYDDWNVAAWFVRGNARIDARRPVDRLQADLPGVLVAARADCHVAKV